MPARLLVALVLTAAVGTAADLDLEAAARRGAELPRLYSLLVNWRGELVLEKYYNGRRSARLANIKSASKSIISALVGIAIERGEIDGVSAAIAPYFPSLEAEGVDPRKKEITVEDLLTMRSGLESTSSRNYGAWVRSRNWVRYALTREMLGPPGLRMTYSTGNTHLLSALLTKATGKSTWQFAQDELAEPLGFTLARWPRDPQGIYFGGNDMEMTPRQMMAFGRLYLNGGRVDGRQVVPEEWVKESWVARTRSRWGDDRLYGYCWWIREMAGYPVFYAWGYGGQFIFCVPELELVVVATSSISSDGRRGHLGAVYDLVERLVVEPVAMAD